MILLMIVQTSFADLSDVFTKTRNLKGALDTLTQQLTQYGKPAQPVTEKEAKKILETGTLQQVQELVQKKGQLLGNTLEEGLLDLAALVELMLII
jgi:hypothetical protein